MISYIKTMIPVENSEVVMDQPISHWAARTRRSLSCRWVSCDSKTVTPKRRQQTCCRMLSITYIYIIIYIYIHIYTHILSTVYSYINIYTYILIFAWFWGSIGATKYPALGSYPNRKRSDLRTTCSSSWEITHERLLCINHTYIIYI